MKLPALHFYVGDWRKSLDVQSLSYHEKGVFFEILCFLHESDDRGKLTIKGRAVTDEAVFRLLGLDNQIGTTALTSLLTAGVLERDTETGALMSRRMVRDEKLREVRKKVGKLGGNPSLVNQNPTTTHNQIPEDEDEDEDESTSESVGGAGGVDEIQSRPNRYSIARIALHWLNEKAGRHYRETARNLAQIQARIDEVKGDIEGIKQMIDRQCARWKGTPQQEYLRPETLFGTEKFNSYYDNRDQPVQVNGGIDKPNPRNAGITGNSEERTKRVLAAIERQQAQRTAAANGMAAAESGNGLHASSHPGSG